MAELLLREELDGLLERFATIVGCRPSALPAEGPEVHEAERPDEGRQQCCHEARSRTRACREDQKQEETLRDASAIAHAAAVLEP